MIRDRDLAMLYARALVAVANADGSIGLEEGTRLTQRLRTRCADAPTLDAALAAAPLAAAELAQLAALHDPFRGGALHPGELARWLVDDAIAVLLAKGAVTREEVARLRELTGALGLSAADFQGLPAVRNWFRA